MNALRYIGLLPTTAVADRLKTANPKLLQYDYAKRITLCAALIIALVSCILVGLGTGNYIRSYVGVSVFGGAMALFCVSCCLYKQQQSYTPDSLDTLYHPLPPPSSSAPSAP